MLLVGVCLICILGDPVEGFMFRGVSLVRAVDAGGVGRRHMAASESSSSSSSSSLNEDPVKGPDSVASALANARKYDAEWLQDMFGEGRASARVPVPPPLPLPPSPPRPARDWRASRAPGGGPVRPWTQAHALQTRSSSPSANLNTACDEVRVEGSVPQYTALSLEMGYSEWEWAQLKPRVAALVLERGMRRPRRGLPDEWLDDGGCGGSSTSIISSSRGRGQCKSSGDQRDWAQQWAPGAGIGTDVRARARRTATAAATATRAATGAGMDDFDTAFNDRLAVAAPFKDKIKSLYDPYNIWDDSFDGGGRREEAGGYSEWHGVAPTAEEERVVRDPAVREQLRNQARPSEQDAWREAYLGTYTASRSGGGSEARAAQGEERTAGGKMEDEDEGSAWGWSRGTPDVADDWFADDRPGGGRDRDGGGVEMNAAGFWPDRQEFRDMLVEEAKWRVGMVGDWSVPLVKAEAKWRYGLYNRFLSFLDAGYADGFDTVGEPFGRDRSE